MVRRRYLLIASFAVSVLLHGTMLAISPRISVMGALPRIPVTRRVFRVHLRAESPVPPVSPAGKTSGRGVKRLASRPGSIEDLLNRQLERLKPLDSGMLRAAGMAQLAKLAAAEPLIRKHKIEPNKRALQDVDAQVIHISEAVARKGVGAPRRLISPVVTRVLAKNDNPALVGDVSPEHEEMLVIPPLPSDMAPSVAGGEAGSAATPASPPLPLAAAVEQPVAEMEPVEPAVTAPMENRVIARAPIVKEIRAERQYEFMDDLVTISLKTYVPSSDRAGFFRVRIQPKENNTIEILPKDITFVIDASSSIIQHKLDLTAAGVRDAIQTLRPKDEFNIVIFRDSETSFRPAPVAASPANIAAAETFLTGLKSYGETDVYRALDTVLKQPTRHGIPDMALVMTDGRPTAGVKDARTIINRLTAQNANGFSIFAFAGGQAVNRYLLDLLTYRNKGETYFAPHLESISRDIVAFFDKSKDPILTDCAANYAGISGLSKEIYPKEIPDFYRGRAVTVYGRFRPGRDKVFSMRLSGLAGKRKKELIFQADLDKADAGGAELARNWAFNKIYYLIGEMCRVGESPELLSELRELSRKYRIKTSYN